MLTSRDERLHAAICLPEIPGGGKGLRYVLGEEDS
jgi:hypothetical protein